MVKKKFSAIALFFLRSRCQKTKKCLKFKIDQKWLFDAISGLLPSSLLRHYSLLPQVTMTKVEEEDIVSQVKDPV